MLGKLAALTLGAAVVLYQRAQNDRRTRNALFESWYANPTAIEGRSLSYFHLMKGGGVLINARYFRLFGISELEQSYLLPLLLYFEGCVYAGDTETEAYYRGKGEARKEGTWDQSMTQAASQLGILDHTLQEEVDLLKAYFARESALMRGEEPLTARAVYELNQERSHDLGFMLRATLRILGRPFPEPLMAVMRPWLAWKEILSDLPTYEEDVRDGSFNTLHMMARLYGPERAVQALEALCNALLDEQLALLRELEPRQVGQIIGLILEREYGVPMELCGGLARIVPPEYLFPTADKVLRDNLARLLAAESLQTRVIVP